MRRHLKLTCSFYSGGQEVLVQTETWCVAMKYTPTTPWLYWHATNDRLCTGDWLRTPGVVTCLRLSDGNSKEFPRWFENRRYEDD